MGIEPTSTAWKAEVLPLNYTRRAAQKMLSQPTDRPGHRPTWTEYAPELPKPTCQPACPGTARLAQRLRTHAHHSRSTGGGGRIRTYEGISRQIYSLLPLAAWVPLREQRAAYSRRPDERCQSMSYLQTGCSGTKPATLPGHCVRPDVCGRQRPGLVSIPQARLASVRPPLRVPGSSRSRVDPKVVAACNPSHIYTGNETRPA